MQAMTLRDMFAGVGRYAKRYRGILLALFLGLSLEALYDVAVRYSLKFIIDHAIAEGDLGALFVILAALAAGAVVFNVVVVGCDYIWAKTGGRILNDIRYDMFTRLQHLPLAYFRRHPTGDLTARFNADLGQIESGMVLTFPLATMGIFEIAMTLAIMAHMHLLLFLIASLGIVMSLLIPRAVQGKALDASFQLRREEGSMVGYLQENLTAQSVVKAYSLESHTSSEFSRRLDELLTKLARANFLSYLVSRLPSLSFLLVQLLVFAVGGWLAINSQITVGDLVAYLALLIGLNTAIYNLTWTIPSFIDATAGWMRVQEIISEPQEIADRPDSKPMPRFQRAIAFEDVRFVYPDSEKAALTDINLRIEAGRYVTLVGKSGAGKTSIVNLLMRFFEARHGRILVDGHDLRDVTLASWRGQVALVPQEVLLFNTSVRENIRLGRLDASDADIEAAARAAEIHEFIAALPEGYGTSVGVAGLRFSGGERQRLALARALVRRPSVLVLDEFSSALDPATEADILKTIARLKGSCTIIAISHRLAMAEDADSVIFLRGGHVAQVGPHRELIADRSSEYYKLWRKGEKQREKATEKVPAVLHPDHGGRPAVTAERTLQPPAAGNIAERARAGSERDRGPSPEESSPTAKDD